MFLYAALIIAGALLLYGLFCEAKKLSRKDLRIIALWVVIAAIILLLLRFGLSSLAVFFGALMAAVPLFQRFIQLLLTLQTAKGLYHKRKGSGQSAADSGKPMTKEEALEVLGLSPNPTKKEILAAYQRLMKKNHPDAGGSAYLASQLNQARDVLLGKKG